ncbi:hypothetical protein [Bifidobacterium avesanii]|uniref:Substrate-binding domain-containing protein n=1 Tax=Bifidobacterium avesanii TaxID=1798157 RepID=A0A7K3TFT2_9BIFI|nr:hypothetical protein [Bifidobacterium avesanii]NEG77500.1 hypothetical protein [Bifidobacterium avesanii]
MRRLGTHLVAVLSALAVSVSLSACAFGQPDPSVETTSPSVDATASTTAAATGSVAIFVPSDGLTLSQSTPTNKWAALSKDIQQAVNAQNAAASVKSTASGDLAAQSQAVQDYVVNALNGKDAGKTDPASTTLIVAPVSNPDAITRQYGDYVRRDVTWSEQTTGETDAAKTRRTAGERLVAALKLAKESGMHVVLVSNQLQGFTPDLFVAFGTAHEIGRIQAAQLVSKLELDRTSADNPKYIEVLLPYAGKLKDGTEADPTFASEAFAGIWEVLGSYFRDGRAVSPSRYLGASSSVDSWRSLAFDPSATDGVKNELTGRLGMKNSSKHQRIDGILAMNDYVASQVVTTLTDLGYTGSAADINPEISISDIVGSFAGKVDLQRGGVPDPRVAPTNDPTASPSANSGITLPFAGSSSTDVEDDTDWPIVTGYGAYVDTIPQIVNGKQWMTALGNRKDTATTLAKAVAALNAGKDAAAEVEGVSAQNYGGEATDNAAQVPTIAKDQLPVAASNLKAMLIDPGYITPADAGL